MDELTPAETPTALLWRQVFGTLNASDVHAGARALNMSTLHFVWECMYDVDPQCEIHVLRKLMSVLG